MKRKITYWLFVWMTMFILPSPWGEGLGVTSFAQTVTPTFIGTTGNSGTVTPTMHISYSVGEAVISTFSIGAGAGVRALTQGFQQPAATLNITSIVAAPNDSICSGNNTTIITTIAGAPSSYTWAPTAGLSCTNCPSPVASPTATTTYTLIVSDGVDSDTGTIKIAVVDPIVTVSVTPNDSICAGNNITLSALATGGLSPYTFTWAPGSQTGTSITDAPTSSTVYIVTVLDKFGCTDAATQSVTVTPIPAAPTATTAINPVCAGSTLTLAAAGGTGTFSWSGPNSFTSSLQYPAIVAISTAGAGTYSVTETVNGCSSPTGTVSVNVNPVPPAPAASASVNPACAGQTVTLLASNTGSSYSWSGPNGFTASVQNPTLVNAQTTASGTYSVTATQNGCTSTAGTVSVTVSNPPIANINGAPTATVTICSGLSATLAESSGAGTYLWSPGGQTTSSIAVSPVSPTSYTVVATNAGGCSSAAVAFVNITPKPIVSIGGSSTICPGGTASLTASATNGSSPYSYVWSTGVSAASITDTPTNTTTYTVTAEDGKGCRDTATQIVTVAPSMTVSLTGTPSSLQICNGDAISLTASVAGGSGTYSYAFSNGGGGPSVNFTVATPTVTTTYSVDVTDISTNCVASGINTVTVNPLPTVGVTAPTTVCSGSPTTLTATGGTSYSWNPGGTTNPLIVNPTAPTGYTVTATDNNGCSDTASTFVSITPAPTASISIAPSTTVCSGTTLTLNASGGNSYVWLNNSQTTASINDIPTGNITYTLVASNGSCSDTTTLAVTISSLTVTASGTNAVCVGQTATITATTNGGIAPLTYAWSTAPPQATPSIIETYTAAGTYNYSVTITDAAGCSGTATHSVVASPAPVPTITASDTTVCLLQSVTLTATGGGTYLWNPGGQTAAAITVNPVNVGNNTYSVTVSNGGCSGGTSINVVASALPSVSALATPGSICAGDTSILSASGAATYTWMPMIAFTSTVAVSPNVNSTYTVFGTDATSGCSNFATTSVTLNSITVDAGADITICPGFTAALNAVVTGTANSYAWTPAQFLNDATVQNPSASPEDSITVFHVTVTGGSCIANDSVTVYAIRTPDCVIKIYNGITPNGDNDNNVWFIDGIQAFPENRVIIFNRWGTNVWNASGYNNKDIVWKGTDQHGNDLPDGTYYFTVELYDGQGGTIFSQTGWVEVTH